MYIHIYIYTHFESFSLLPQALSNQFTFYLYKFAFLLVESQNMFLFCLASFTEQAFLRLISAVATVSILFLHIDEAYCSI